MNWFARWCRPDMAVLSDIQMDVASTRLAVNQLFRKIDSIKGIIMATADEIVTAFDAETDRVAGVLTEIQSELATAIAGSSAASDAAVAAALAKFDEPLERLREVGKDPANPIPPVGGGADTPPVDTTPVDGDGSA